MIITDQPTLFGESLIVGVSSLSDGNMSFHHGDDDETVQGNRQQFLSDMGIEASQATQVKVVYADTVDFMRYKVIDDDDLGEGILQPETDLHADGLVVTRPDHALFLPLADCVGAVLYDPVNHIMMLSHLGRHSVVAGGATKSVDYMTNEFGSNPAELLVWLSPAASAEGYPLHALQNRGLHEVICTELVTMGVHEEHIEVSSVDTTDSTEYFSHSQFLAGEQSDDGRFAIVAMMRD